MRFTISTSLIALSLLTAACGGLIPRPSASGTSVSASGPVAFDAKDIGRTVRWLVKEHQAVVDAPFGNDAARYHAMRQFKAATQKHKSKIRWLLAANSVQNRSDPTDKYHCWGVSLLELKSGRNIVHVLIERRPGDLSGSHFEAEENDWLRSLRSRDIVAVKATFLYAQSLVVGHRPDRPDEGDDNVIEIALAADARATKP